MSELTSADVDHLAKLARISLSDEEKAKLGEELPKIVEFFAEIQKAGAEKEDTAGELISLEDLRPDEPGSGPEGLSLEQLEKLAPEFKDSQIVVPAVFGEVENA